MSASGTALGLLIASKIISPQVDIFTKTQMTDTWIKVGEAICEFLSTQQIQTDPITMTAPGAVTLANGGGPAIGSVIVPPTTGRILLP